MTRFFARPLAWLFLSTLFVFTPEVVFSQPPPLEEDPGNPYDPGPPVEVGWIDWNDYDEQQNPCPPQNEGLCVNQAWSQTATANIIVYANPTDLASQQNGCFVIVQFCYRCCNGIVEVYLKGIFNSPSQIACLKNKGVSLWDNFVRQQIDAKINEAAMDAARRSGHCDIDPYLPCDQQPPINNVYQVSRLNAPCYRWVAVRRLVNNQYQYDFLLEGCMDSDYCIETWRMCINTTTGEIDQIKISSTPSSQICPSGTIWDDPRVPGALQQCFTLCN